MFYSALNAFLFCKPTVDTKLKSRYERRWKKVVKSTVSLTVSFFAFYLKFEEVRQGNMKRRVTFELWDIFHSKESQPSQDKWNDEIVLKMQRILARPLHPVTTCSLLDLFIQVFDFIEQICIGSVGVPSLISLPTSIVSLREIQSELCRVRYQLQWTTSH